MALILNGTTGFQLPPAGSLKLYEDNGNGTNFVGIKAPSSVSADITFTLPAADGTSGQVLVTNGSKVLSFNTVLTPSNIGVSIQPYDANTAKYNATTSNFTGTLQQNGSNVLAVSSIGVSVQAYDANTAKYNATTSNFTGALQQNGKDVVTTTGSGSVQLGSLGVGVDASGTTGEIRATDNITAFYSSDIKFKENVKPIENALDKVVAIGGKTFDWTDEYISNHGGEDGYFVQKNDFGVIAQDVQKVFPQAVRVRPDGSLAVDYEKLSALAFAAICELKMQLDNLKTK